MSSTRQWVFAKVPETSTDQSAWKIVEAELPPVAEGQVLIETMLVSVDPYLRIQQSRGETWQSPYKTGDVQHSFALGRVIESKVESLPVGSIVRTYSGWVEKAVLSASDCERIPDELIQAVGPEQQLAALGMVGRTAFFGIDAALSPLTPGMTALVTGAAGAVGSLVVQLLKKRGLRVIGTAGSDAKCDTLRELGCDVALNYRTTKMSYKELDALKEAAPDGIDRFFDNTGGEIFDAAIQLMNVHGRIAICGQISQYDSLDDVELGPRFLHRLIYKRINIQGILQRDCSPEQSAEHQRSFAEMLQSGELKAPITVEEGGFDAIPKAQAALFTGGNTGKLLVRLKK